MEITNETYRQIFSVYSNCEVQYLGNHLPLKIEYVKKNGLKLFGHTQLKKFEHCKLLCKIPSDICDLDAAKVHKIYSDVEWGSWQQGKGIISMYKQDLLNYNSRIVAFVDYLRSKDYDFGYGSIPSLIEAGIAIKKQNS